MTDLRALAVDRDAPQSERYVALYTLLHDDADAHLDVAARVADEPLGDVAAWSVPLQAVALLTLMPRDPARWSARLDEVARATPGSWVFEAIGDGAPFERVRPLFEHLATTGTAHVAHPALARLLAPAWEHRARWALRALRDPDREVQVIALEAAPRFTDDDVPIVAEMLRDPSADARLVAVEALASVPGELARATLQAHLAHERSARVRRVILETHGVVAQGDTEATAPAPEGSAAALVQRAEATVTALAKSVAPWFQHRPALHWEDGAEAPWSVGEYILFCQHAKVGAELDERALESASLLDRASLSAWAVALFEAWVSKRADVKHHWCVALTLALGGDAAVPVVQREVEAWHRGGRRALAAQAAQLIAYVGGDVAVRALTEIAAAHSNDQLGTLATSSIDAEALARGLSREGIADAVVPRWGLNAEGMGWLDYGRRRFRVRLDASKKKVLDVSLFDGSGEVIPAPPRPTRADDPLRSTEALAQWKALRAELPLVVKSETRRFEEALCAGRVWTHAHWATFVLGHPVLRALAERFVWQVQNPDEPSPRFARTLRGAWLGERDEPVRVTGEAAVSIAHPVALDDEAWDRWRAAFEAAPVPAQPFAQLTRAGWRDEGAGDAMELPLVAGRTVRALSDRARTRPPVWTRAGWEPAPVEGGLCRVFFRRFGALEAVCEVDGIALWSESSRESTVRAVRVRAGHGDSAPWCALRDVPPCVVSEAMRAAAHMIDGGEDPDRALRQLAAGSAVTPRP